MTSAGGQVVTATYGLGEIPLYVCEGCVVPMKTMASVTTPPDPLMWTVWPGGAAGGGGSYWEDDGVSLEYASATCEAGAVCFTLAWSRAGGVLNATAGASRGSYAGMPRTRSQGLALRGVGLPSAVACNGVPAPRSATAVPGWYVADAWSLAVTTGSVVVTCAPTDPAAAPLKIQLAF